MLHTHTAARVFETYVRGTYSSETVSSSHSEYLDKRKANHASKHQTPTTNIEDNSLLSSSIQTISLLKDPCSSYCSLIGFKKGSIFYKHTHTQQKGCLRLILGELTQVKLYPAPIQNTWTRKSTSCLQTSDSNHQH